MNPVPPTEPPAAGWKSFRVPLLLLILLAIAWVFPRLWYEPPIFRGVWFTPATEIEGWTFREIPVSEAAENILTADEAFNGEFIDARGRVVRVFLTSQKESGDNQLMLFLHPPDRCWLITGFEAIPAMPGVVEMRLGETDFAFERRVFRGGTHYELVYYTGLISGVPVGFRLGEGKLPPAGPNAKEARRMFDLKRLPKSFTERRNLEGAKQFIRISTTATLGNEIEADLLVQEFAKLWLLPGNFE